MDIWEQALSDEELRRELVDEKSSVCGSRGTRGHELWVL